MKNLAGDINADNLVKEELYLAGIPIIECEGKGEVPYKHVGRVGNWTFKRAWTYWIATVPDGEKGLPLKIAMDLYNMKHPNNDSEIMGNIIRTGGHCGCPSPDEYGAQPIYDDDFDKQLENIGYEKIYSNILKKEYIPITVEEVSKLCNEGKLTIERYVDCYHIDNLIGLKILADVIKNNPQY
jgi:hypothetical protein